MQESTKITHQWINSADYERDFLKEAIYLQEEVMLLEQEIRDELIRNAAIIKVIKDESKDNIQEVRDINPARIYVGYDLPFEDDSRGVRCENPLSEYTEIMSTLSNNSQERVNH